MKSVVSLRTACCPEKRFVGGRRTEGKNEEETARVRKVWGFGKREIARIGE